MSYPCLGSSSSGDKTHNSGLDNEAPTPWQLLAEPPGRQSLGTSALIRGRHVVCRPGALPAPGHFVLVLAAVGVCWLQRGEPGQTPLALQAGHGLAYLCQLLQASAQQDAPHCYRRQGWLRVASAGEVCTMSLVGPKGQSTVLPPGAPCISGH